MSDPWDTAVCALLSPSNLARAGSSPVPAGALARSDALHVYHVDTTVGDLGRVLRQHRPDGISAIRATSWAPGGFPLEVSAVLAGNPAELSIGAFPIRGDGAVLIPPVIGVERFFSPDADALVRFKQIDMTPVDPGPLRVNMFMLPANTAENQSAGARRFTALADPEGRRFGGTTWLGAYKPHAPSFYRDFSQASPLDFAAPEMVAELRRYDRFPHPYDSRPYEQGNGIRRAIWQVMQNGLGPPGWRLYPPAAFTEVVYDGDSGIPDLITSIRSTAGDPVSLEIRRPGNPIIPGAVAFEWTGAEYDGPPIPIARDVKANVRVTQGRAAIGGILFDREHQVVVSRLNDPEAECVFKHGGATWRWTSSPWSLERVERPGKRRRPEDPGSAFRAPGVLSRP